MNVSIYKKIRFMMRNLIALKTENQTMTLNLKCKLYTIHHIYCMHRHGHVFVWIINMSIFERNVLERAWYRSESEWCCTIWLASTVCVCIMSIFMLRTLFSFALSIRRRCDRISNYLLNIQSNEYQHHTSYWDWAM